VSIETQVADALKTAMKAKDTVATRALRNIRAAFLSRKKEDGAEVITDADALVVLRRLHKQLTESVEAYEGGGREDLAADERAERAVLEGFLPRLADEPTTRGWIEAAIASTGAAGPADLGKVMGALMKGHKDELDGKLANRIVRELLGA
jgi:uncharacterized protein YqeY